MEIRETGLAGVFIIEPRVFEDERGWFFEAWNRRRFDEALGPVSFVQDNHSRSVRGALRGIHYQRPHPQGKLVRCALGAVWDVAVDLRRSSAQFGEWTGVELSAENKRQMWIPEGFGHAFLTLTDAAEVLYKATDFYDPAADRTIAWNDPVIGIEWPVAPDTRLLSPKDRAAPRLDAALVYD